MLLLLPINFKPAARQVFPRFKSESHGRRKEGSLEPSGETTSSDNASDNAFAKIRGKTLKYLKRPETSVRIYNSNNNNSEKRFHIFLARDNTAARVARGRRKRPREIRPRWSEFLAVSSIILYSSLTKRGRRKIRDAQPNFSSLELASKFESKRIVGGRIKGCGGGRWREEGLSRSRHAHLKDRTQPSTRQHTHLLDARERRAARRVSLSQVAHPSTSPSYTPLSLSFSHTSLLLLSYFHRAQVDLQRAPLRRGVSSELWLCGAVWW